ncbi:hypothetical protein R4Y45_06220 [Holzapfeliella sp. He02]|uniref:Uncharacterized protein n=1 Tax=Holzapfeliella saturejae TaxID=3082953 RepID=A0ABU8SIF0_9LACO
MKNLFKILFLSQKEDKKIPTNAVYHKQNAVGIGSLKKGLKMNYKESI